MNLFKAMATVAGMTGLSRIAGFVRDILTAAILGAGPVADAFFVALKLPNFFRRVTAEGAFSVSFIPLYSKKLETDDADAAARFAGNIFAVMCFALSIFTVIAIAAMPFVIYAIAPGFSEDGMRYDLAVELTRITFPYLLLMSLSALVGGMLNANNKFAAFAFAPVLFNISLIIALVYGTNYTETAGHALSWGIIAAGVLQLMMLLTVLWRFGIPIKIRMPKFDGELIKLLKLMGPGIIGAGVMHINLFADMIIASMLETGAISYLYYADRLNQLPLGVVGIAVGTALLPMLSRAMASGDKDTANDLYNRSLEYCLVFALPAAVALAVIPHTLVSVLFQRGEFMADDAMVTSFVLIGYAAGLPAYIFVKVLSTVYWAHEDTATPVRIAIKTTILNIMLSIFLVQFIGVAGIAFATGVAGWVQFILLQRGLKTALPDNTVSKLDDRFKSKFPKIIVASVIMGLGVFAVDYHLVDWLNDAFAFSSIFALTIIVATGMGLYATLLFLSGVLNRNDIAKYFRK